VALRQLKILRARGRRTELPEGEDSKTADRIIAGSKKASIRREFPGQYLHSTMEEIKNAAGKGHAAARRALRLLTSKTFDR